MTPVRVLGDPATPFAKILMTPLFSPHYSQLDEQISMLSVKST